MTFPDMFVQTCKWFGYAAWIAVTIFLTFGPLISVLCDIKWKYPWQSTIIGIVSGLFLITYIGYKMQGVQ